MFTKPIINEEKPNIVLEDDIIEYWYDINPISVLYGNDSILAEATKVIENFLKEVNMEGNIYIVPFELNKQEMIRETKRLHKIFVEDKGNEIDTFNNLITSLTTEFDGVYYFYKIFLCLLDERGDLRKKRTTSKLFGSTVNVKRMMDIAVFTETNLFEKVTMTLKGTKRAVQEDVIKVFNYLYTPNISENDTFVDVEFKPSTNNLEMMGIDENGKKKSMFVKYGMVSSLPDFPKPTKVFVKIQDYNFPVMIVLKYSILSHKKAYGETISRKTEIEKDIKFHQREYKSNNTEYLKARQEAIKGEDIFFVQEEDEFLCQILFRVVAYTPEIAELRMQYLSKDLSRSKIVIDTLSGFQRKAMLHTMPILNYLGKKNIQYLNMRAFASLNLLCGYKSGDEKGTLFGVRTSNDSPVLSDKMAVLEHRRVNNSTTTILICETRAGKSFFENIDIIRDYDTFGARTLIVEPKPQERKESYAKLPHKYQKIIKYVDLMGSESVGMMDALVLAENEEEAYNNAFFDFSTFAHILEMKFIDVDVFKKYVIEYYRKAKEKSVLPRFTNLLEILIEQQESEALRTLSKNMLALKDLDMAKLFFAEANYNVSFDEDKYIFVYEIANLPDIKRFDGTNKKHLLANMVIGRVDALTKSFMVKFRHEKNKVVIEEYATYKMTPSGADTVKKMNRLSATYGTDLVIVNQILSDFDTQDEAGIFSNTGQFLIGKLADKKERLFVCDKLGLSHDHETLFTTKYEFLHKNNDGQFTKLKAVATKELERAFNTKGVDNNYES